MCFFSLCDALEKPNDPPLSCQKGNVFCTSAIGGSGPGLAWGAVGGRIGAWRLPFRAVTFMAYEWPPKSRTRAADPLVTRAWWHRGCGGGDISAGPVGGGVWELLSE